MNPKSLGRLSALTVSVMLAGGLALTDAPSAAAAVTCTGSSIRGDVNGDNRGEVAVTQLGRGGLSGAVHLFYGTAGGLVTDASGTARDDQFIDQGTPLVPGTAEPGDEFGAATAFGDFDADGCSDLAVGSPGEDSGVGALTILYGSPRGLAATSAQRLSFANLFGTPGPNGRFGDELAVGDFNSDGVDDVAVAAPELVVDGLIESGGVAVIYGEAGGSLNSGTRADLITKSTPGVPGNAVPNDYFGASLAAGDFDFNGGGEQLAIVSLGSTYRDRLASVQVVARGPSGFTGQQPAPITQQTAQGHGQSRPEDAFGTSVAFGHFNADPYGDLAIGAPGRGCLECDEEWGYGEVVVLFGTETGLTTTGRQLWTQDSAGIAGPARPGDGFGKALAAGDLDDGESDDLAVGAPEDNDATGSVSVLFGNASGLTGVGSRTFTQATAGIAGASGPFGFGGTLAVPTVQSGSYGNLVIGADRQDIGRIRTSGLINQLPATRTGPRAAGSRAIHLDTGGVKGRPETYAQFGFELS